MSANKLIKVPGDMLGQYIIQPDRPGRYEVEMRDGTTWLMGCANGIVQNLSWFDWKVFFALIRLLQEPDGRRVSLRHILRSLRITAQGEAAKKVKSAIERLRHYDVEIRHTNGEGILFPLIHAVVKTRGGQADASRRMISLGHLWISSEIIEVINKNPRLLDLDVIAGIKNGIAGALFLVLPARAYHFSSRENAAKIRLSTLLQHLGRETTPLWRFRQVLTRRGKHSVLSQLNGLSMSRGEFRIELDEDDMLHCWMDSPKDPKKWGLAWKAFQAGGGRIDTFLNAMSKCPKLTPDEWAKIKSAGVADTRRSFLDNVKRLLDSFSPNAFWQIFEHERAYLTSGIARSPGAVLVSVFCDVVRAAPSAFSPHNSMWWLPAASTRRKTANVKRKNKAP